MRLSVVIPTYNRRDRVAEAVESVVTQSHPPDQTVVVDDGSTDGTSAFLSIRYAQRIVLVERANGGPAAARNTGIAAATGDVVAFLDSDDIWCPGTAERFRQFYANHPDAAFVFGDLWIEATGSQPARLDLHEVHLRRKLLRAPERIRDFFSFQLRRDLTLTSSLAARTDALTSLGGFDERFLVCEDVHLWLRAARRFPFSFIPEILANRRRHDANLVNDWARLQNFRIRILEDLLRTLPSLTRHEKAALHRRLSSVRYDLGSWHFRQSQFAQAHLHLSHCTGLVRSHPACLYKRIRSRLTRPEKRIP